MSRYEDNADYLRKMSRHDDDLSRSRMVYFSTIFPDRDLAETFAAEARKRGFAIELRPVEDGNGDWDVSACKDMVPSAKNITENEKVLGQIGEDLDGTADGWGFFIGTPIYNSH